MAVLPRSAFVTRFLTLLLSFGCAWQLLSAMVPPHPMYKNPPHIKTDRPSELFGPRSINKNKALPQNVLVLRVQFSDQAFQSTPAYPDSLEHNQAYFDRWMLQVGDFYSAASHGGYNLTYLVWNDVFTLSHPMSYYGNDTADTSDELVPDMLAELIALADPQINFSDFDAFVVFHAGSGQESDISSLRTGEMWSTFITRSDLQAAFDPENDNYPGIQTNDGKIIKEIVLVPESEYQDYFPGPGQENASAYLFSIYGVICHQFGHQVGLPTLFDNYSANGASQGIGNWGLMGTGLWNANGNVPAQLDAWCRYYLGWEQAITITEDTQNVAVDYFLDNSDTAHRLYKIPISNTEYFLIENRQQNPDNSYATIHDSADSTLSVYQQSFTFALLDPSVQDYYPPPNQTIPYFNFMENRYKGCEWDFFLPGLGGPVLPGENIVDGSGMLIWHIDENVINANFDPQFEQNHVNFDAQHKGVDVEEADGIQHLDTEQFDYYMNGGPYDTFRNDPIPSASNTYFGQETIRIPNESTPNDTTDYNVVMHLPAATSYYGGVPLEVYDISTSGLQMRFSIRFGWKLSTNFRGVNTLDACAVDADHDGKDEIFYPMPDGNLFLWKNEEIASGFPIDMPGKLQNYLWDGDAFILATDLTTNPDIPLLGMKKLQNSTLTTLITALAGRKWAAPIMAYDDKLALPYQMVPNAQGATGFKIETYNKNTQASDDIWSSETDTLIANLAFYTGKVYAISRSLSDSTYFLQVMTHGVPAAQVFPLDIPADSTIVAMSIARIRPDSQGDIIFQTPYSIYLTDLSGAVVNGYPIILPFYSDAQVTLHDTDYNGTLDYLVSGENSFAVYNYVGKNMLINFNGLVYTDSLYVTSGVLGGDWDANGKTEYLGTFSLNRTIAFDHKLSFMDGYPVSYADRSHNLPFIHMASDSIVYAWTATDNGNLYRRSLPQSAIEGIDSGWYCKYANLQRTSARDDSTLANQYKTADFFVNRQNFVFPSPVRSIYEQKLTFQIMTNRTSNVEVSVFNIAGNLIYKKKVKCNAYLINRDLIDLPVAHLASGVYLCVYKSGDNLKRFKFAVEK